MYGTITLYGGLFQGPSINSLTLVRPYGLIKPYNPRASHPGRKRQHIFERLDPLFLTNRLLITYAQDETHEFGLFPFRSPLLGESLLLSLPPGTKMFQFPGFISAQIWRSEALCFARSRTFLDLMRFIRFIVKFQFAELALRNSYLTTIRRS